MPFSNSEPDFFPFVVTQEFRKKGQRLTASGSRPAGQRENLPHGLTVPHLAVSTSRHGVTEPPEPPCERPPGAGGDRTDRVRRDGARILTQELRHALRERPGGVARKDAGHHLPPLELSRRAEGKGVEPVSQLRRCVGVDEDAHGQIDRAVEDSVGGSVTEGDGTVEVSKAGDGDSVELGVDVQVSVKAHEQPAPQCRVGRRRTPLFVPVAKPAKGGAGPQGAVDTIRGPSWNGGAKSARDIRHKKKKRSPVGATHDPWAVLEARENERAHINGVAADASLKLQQRRCVHVVPPALEQRGGVHVCP